QEVEDLGKLSERPGSVLILPSAIALNDRERAQIANFQAHGGGVLATWASGSRDGIGQWRGWQFMSALGFNVLGQITSTTTNRQMVIKGETPLTENQSAGQRVWMTNSSEPLLRMTGEMIAAQFADWSREVAADHSREGAVLYTEGKNSRTAAFAFSESSWDAAPVPIHQLVDSTLNWLQRRPGLALASWPNGSQAAQVVEMDTEQDFGNGALFSAMMKKEQLRPTFFVVTSVAQQNTAALLAYATSGEIAYHGDIHDGFKGQSAMVQKGRLVNMQQQLGSVFPDSARTAIGFRAPYESYDATTEQMLHDVGIQYHVAGPNRSEAQLPLFVKMPGVALEDELMVIPRTERDDFNLLAGSPTPDAIRGELLADLNSTLGNGGLGLLSVHSQNFVAGSPLVQAMPAYLAQVATYSRVGVLWAVPAGDINHWWRERRRFRIAASVLRGQRLQMDITVTGHKPVKGATIDVFLPNRKDVPVVRGSKVGAVAPEIRRVDDFRSQFVFGSLAPGDYSYQVNFSERKQ
ncbi:MAG: polysaccharide deacetylase family protein, partial [Dokdonella sp.]